MQLYGLLLLLATTLTVNAYYTSRDTSRCSRFCPCYYQSLFCRGYQYDSLPSDLEPTVQNIDFTDNSLEVITNETFSKFKALRKLLLGNNKISQLSEDAFSKQQRLNALDLSGNLLTKIPAMTFDPVRRRLEHLTLQANEIVKIEGTFQRMRVLKTLNLKNNRIQVLTAETLFQNRKLRYLQLADNNITYISPDAFKRHSELQYVFLDNNKLGGLILMKLPSKKLVSLSMTNCVLRSIPEGISRSIQQLNLAGNEMVSLTETNFSTLRNLRSIDLSRNMLSEVHERTFRNAAELKVLYLSANKLQQVPKKLPSSLEQLSLSHNRISDVAKESFTRLRRLQTLSLNENMIEFIHKKAFNGLTELRSLDLSSNVITRINTNLFKDLVGLKDLYLSNNPLLVIEPGAMDGLWSLDTLSLDNIVKNVRVNGALLSQSPQLRSLNIHNSQSIAKVILKFDLQMYHLRSVEYLNLMQNNLQMLPATFPQYLPNLRRIQLSYNPWSCTRDLYWLKVWLVKGLVEEPHLLYISCEQPAHLRGRHLIDLDKYDWVSSDVERA